MLYGSDTEFSAEIERGRHHNILCLPATNNDADTFTTSLVGPEQSKYAAKLCGQEKYNATQDREHHEHERVSGVEEHSQLKSSTVAGVKTWQIRISAHGS